MKKTHTPTKRVMSASICATLLFTFTPFSIPSFAEKSLVDLVSGSAQEVIDQSQNSLLVGGVSAIGGSEKITLIWDAVTDATGEKITQYEVSYGQKPYASTKKYDFSVQTGALTINETGIVSFDVKNLSPNTSYYFGVKAISSTGVKSSSFSEEVNATVDNGGEDIAPFVKDAVALSKNIVKISFSEKVRLPENEPQSAFFITEKENTENALEVTNALYRTNYFIVDETDFSKLVAEDEFIYIQTEGQTPGKEYTITVSSKITDVSGKSIESGATDSDFFTGLETDAIPDEEKIEVLGADSKTLSQEKTLATPTPSQTPVAETVETLATSETVTDETMHAVALPDTTPPEDIEDLITTYKERITDFLITLTWKKSLDTAGDLATQLLYTSSDKGNTWGDAVDLGKNKSSQQLSGKPETEYTFKITTKDESGNESTGVIKSVRLPALAQTGAPLLLALGLGFIGAGVTRIRQKKNKE